MKLTLSRCASVFIFLCSTWFAAESARAGRAMGADVSGYQPQTLDWAAIRASGISYVWCKATEGTTFHDANFLTYMAQAKAAGVVIGPYHYARPDDNHDVAGADAEAHFFWSVIKPYVLNDGLTLLPMLDWETPITNYYTKTTLSIWANEWCNALVREAGSNGIVFRPTLYTYTSYATTWCDSTVTQWPLNMASYPSSPSPQKSGPAITPWTNLWYNWQYADTEPASGGDADVFAFDTNVLMQVFVVGNTPPQNTNAVLGSNATFKLTAGSRTTPAYQWYFNGAKIVGATQATYTVTNVQPSNAGPYSVIFTNTANPFISTATLGVIAPPTNAVSSVLAPTSLVGFYPGDGTAKDVFGTNDYTPYNQVTYVAGKRGLTMHFDGVASYLSNNAASLPVPWTATMWVNRQASPDTNSAITGDGVAELKLEQYPSTHSVGYTKFGVGDYTFNYVTPVGVWTHLAFVGTSAGTSLYVNGALQSSLTNTFSLPRKFVGVGYLASSALYVDYMEAGLDEFQIFNRALSATEINSIYASGTNGLVRAPEVTDAYADTNGIFHMALRGLTGKNYTIHSSTDLETWTTAGTVANTAGTNQFTDASAPSNVQKFYRVSQ